MSILCDRCGGECRDGTMMQLELVCGTCQPRGPANDRMRYLVERYIQLIKVERELRRLEARARHHELDFGANPAALDPSR